MKIVSALVVVTLSAACASPEPHAVGNAALVTSAAEPVKLLHADMRFDCTYDRGVCVESRYQVNALIEVQNLAYDKTVALFGTWSYRGGAWADLALAEYAGPAGDGAEYWRATTGWQSGSARGQTATFAVRYDAAGQSRWDNNGGADYCVGRNRTPCSNQVLGASTVALTEIYPVAGRLVGRVQVEDLGPDKVVRVVYTTDDWATVSQTYGTYGYGFGGTEYWNFDATLPPTAYEAELAIEYIVGGHSHWDNNAGANYRVDIVPAAVP